MGTLLFANNAISPLSAAITSGSTTIPLSAGTGIKFPQPTSGQSFVATLYDAATRTIYEIVSVTAMSGDVATVVRGQEGTTALNWAIGDIFENNVTAGSLQAFQQIFNFSTGLYVGFYNLAFADGDTPPFFQASLATAQPSIGTWSLVGPTGMYADNYTSSGGGNSTWYFLKTRTA